MIEQHLEESKQQISDLADKILLNDEDLEIDNRMFAALRQKTENIILSDYLIEKANERLENLKVFISDESEVEKYKNDLISFIQELLREKL
ncbi:hypothetical protein [Aquimarina agarivorans]|uniref:hypothetical protein n=1 Tax=Aquimarina agarivorans TaxID=980584 RepID=UPI000248EA03|nr:hypothetical protein [Aquimarina agarivorans]